MALVRSDVCRVTDRQLCRTMLDSTPPFTAELPPCEKMHHEFNEDARVIDTDDL